MIEFNFVILDYDFMYIFCHFAYITFDSYSFKKQFTQNLKIQFLPSIRIILVQPYSTFFLEASILSKSHALHHYLCVILVFFFLNWVINDFNSLVRTRFYNPFTFVGFSEHLHFVLVSKLPLSKDVLIWILFSIASLTI